MDVTPINSQTAPQLHQILWLKIDRNRARPYLYPLQIWFYTPIKLKILAESLTQNHVFSSYLKSKISGLGKRAY